MVCTLVSNVRDHEPFISAYSETTDLKETGKMGKTVSKRTELAGT